MMASFVADAGSLGALLALAVVLLLFPTSYSLSQSPRLFAGSFDGTVYEINLATLMPRAIAQPSGDCSYLAIRPRDGLAVCSSANGDGILSGTLAVFNAFDGTSFGSNRFSYETMIGPFYDENTDAFFYFIKSIAASNLTLASFDPKTMTFSMKGNVSYLPNQYSIDFEGSWTYYSKARVACGISNMAMTVGNCISLDSLAVTWQYVNPSPSSSNFYLTSYPDYGVAQITYNNLDNGCVDRDSGSAVVTLINPFGSNTKLLGILQNVSPSFCPFNAAVFITESAAYLFSIQKHMSGFYVLPFNGSAPQFTLGSNDEFNNNVETFLFV